MSTSWDLRSLVDTSLGLVIVCFVFLFWIGSILIPVGKLLRRTGHSPLWSAFFLIPGANVIALWVFSFKRWPTDRPNP